MKNTFSYDIRTLIRILIHSFHGLQDLFLEKILKVIFDCGNVLTEERFHQVHGLYLNGLHRYVCDKFLTLKEFAKKTVPALP